MQQREGVGGVVPVAKGELKPVVLAGLFFFCVLFGTMLLRPAREAMGVERGMGELRYLFIWTAVVSLVVALLFGGLVSRMDRRRFIPIGFRVVMACLVVFAVSRAFLGDDVKAYAGRVFYVWFSVFNLFLTSVFWAYMADIWRVDQAKRLYPVIGVGGTLGAIAGASLPWTLGEKMSNGPVWLMVMAIVMFEIAVWVMLALDRVMSSRPGDDGAVRRPHAVGGNMVSGLSYVLTSPYLIGVSIYIGLVAVSSTFIYFAGAEMVVDMEDELSGRLHLFAQLDVYKQVATLFFQLFVTSRLIKWIGIGGTLCVLPALTVAGFGAVWVMGRGSEAWVWGTFAIFQGLHSACRYAFIRPARETLFSVLSEGEKYKAKTVLDMFVYRGGDVAGAAAQGGLVKLGVAAMGPLILVTAPMAGVWVVLAIALGVIQKRKADSPVGKKQQELAAGT